MPAKVTLQFDAALKDIRRRAEVLVSGLTPAQLTKRPYPEKWSIPNAFCI